MANTDNYSQFADFDPDNLPVSKSNSIESNSHQNEDVSAPVWDRKRLAELVNFEEDTEPRPARKSESNEPDPDKPNNIISRHELFEPDSDDPNHSKTERTFSNSPWTKGGLIGMGAMVVFVSAGLFLNNVFNRGKVAQAPSTPTPTPTFTPAPTSTENETGKLKTEIALGTQAEQLAALNRAKSPSNPNPTRNPSITSTATNTSPNQTNQTPTQRVNSSPTPTRNTYPVYRPPANNPTPPPPRVIVREVVKRVPVPVQQPVIPVAKATTRPAAVAPVQPRQEIVRSTVPLRSAPTPKPTPTATQASPPPDPLAQWQALARVGSYGQADVPENDTQEVAAVPVPGQSAELAMPRPTGIPTTQVTAYTSTAISPNVPGAIATAELSSIALPKAIPVIASPPASYTNQGTGNDVATEENLLLNGSPSQIAQSQPNLVTNNSEENLPLNDSRSPITQSQPNLVANNSEENLPLNDSRATITQPQPNLVGNNSEENLPINDSRSPITQPQSNLVATNPGMPAVDAEEDVLLGSN